jgi:DNA polymerase-3 subunit epsilon
MPTFTAIDFETAQGYRWSICQVGLVRVENGVITETFNQLVQPPDNHYWSRFTDIHGIDASQTRNAPTFDQVWPHMMPYIKGQHVVAHNAAFDMNCLQQTLSYYSLSTPVFQKHCTYRLYGKNLKSLCQLYQIQLNHHDALSDAIACAKLFLMHQKRSAQTL